MLHCHVLGTRAAAFSCNNVSAVFLLHTRGSRKWYICLGFGKGDRLSKRLGCRTSMGGNFEVLVPIFFLHTIHCLNVFDLAVCAASERYYVHALWSSTENCYVVVGVKRWRGIKIQAPQSVSASSGYIPWCYIGYTTKAVQMIFNRSVGS